ncbi:unnamed protein product, partial [Discosporangium mesarthrocarpum]
LEDVTPEQCYNTFRFRKEDIPSLTDLLHIPDPVRTSGGGTYSAEEVLLLLNRLACPGRLNDFRERRGEASMILDTTVEKHGHILTNGIHKWAPYLFAAAAPIRRKTVCTGNGEMEGFAFVDRTLRPHCKSIHGDNKKVVYSGYLRIHVLKFLGMVFGPVAGSRHDSCML